jgi:tetratricopeptide (TPR) repeat protein
MRTRILTHTLPLLCSGALLVACSSLPWRQEAAKMAAASADDDYLRGRNLHLAHRYEEAIAAYQQALQTDGVHVNARNGLAIAYAEQRDFAKAIPIWRELTRGATLASGTSTAFLFGNLGHAYFLNGQYDDALIALEKACLLDPLNHRTWQHLGETLQQLGQDERAKQMLRQASALREHDFRADYAAADGGAKLPAIEQAVKTRERPDQDWAFVEVVSKPNGMLELRRVVPARSAPPAGEPADAAEAGQEPARHRARDQQRQRAPGAGAADVAPAARYRCEGGAADQREGLRGAPDPHRVPAGLPQRGRTAGRALRRRQAGRGQHDRSRQHAAGDRP